MATTNHSTTSQHFCCRHCGADVAIAQEPGGDMSYQCQNDRCQWACSIDCPEALALKSATVADSTLVDIPHGAEYAPAAPRTAADRAADKAAYYLAQGLRIVETRNAYLMPSGSRGNVIHRVQNGVCSCEAGQHGRSCWHVAAIGLVNAEQVAA